MAVKLARELCFASCVIGPVLTRESSDRFDIRVRSCNVWVMSGARKREHLHTRERLCQLGNYRREDRRALVPERKQDWL